MYIYAYKICAMPTSTPIHPDAAWLYQPGRLTYPDSLTQARLTRACLAAAGEINTARLRTSAARWQLAENVAHLLRAVALREAYGTAPGSMYWDIRHCRRSLQDAAGGALEAEYRRSRNRVLSWAIQEAFGGEEFPVAADQRLQLTLEGRRGSVLFWSHESDAGHAAAIAHLDAMHRLRPEAEISPTFVADLGV